MVKYSVTHEEKCGPDMLIEIYRDPNSYNGDAVVRWCPLCGAIVIDVDFDGRTAPGRIMTMRFPRNK